MNKPTTSIQHTGVVALHDFEVWFCCSSRTDKNGELMINTLPLTYRLYNPHEALSAFCFTHSTTTEEHFDIAFSTPGVKQTKSNFDPNTDHKMHRVAVPNPRNGGEDYFFTNGFPVTCVEVGLARQIWVKLVKEGWVAE